VEGDETSRPCARLKGVARVRVADSNSVGVSQSFAIVISGEYRDSSRYCGRWTVREPSAKAMVPGAHIGLRGTAELVGAVYRDCSVIR